MRIILEKELDPQPENMTKTQRIMISNIKLLIVIGETLTVVNGIDSNITKFEIKDDCFVAPQGGVFTSLRLCK